MAEIRANPAREVETIACFVHGALCAGHILGLTYNIRRKNWGDATIHGLAAIYDLWATNKHYRRVRSHGHPHEG